MTQTIYQVLIQEEAEEENDHELVLNTGPHTHSGRLCFYICVKTFTDVKRRILSIPILMNESHLDFQWNKLRLITQTWNKWM